MTDKTANTQTGPKRIQRKRSKGWRMPEGAVSVTRPGKWGNPFIVTEAQTAAAAVQRFRDAVNGGEEKNCLEFWIGEIRSELRGKDLACWCHLCERHKDGKPFSEHCDECAPCHADITGEIANAKDSL